jgi:putative ABC transport system ATP-binding protein
VETILDGRGLTRTYWLGATPVAALSGVDITVGRGEFIVLQGPSGSGKTTLINLFGFVFQSFNLVAVLTASENVEYPMMLKGLSREARRLRAADLLARVGLSEKADVRPDLLSGGQRQRVAVARALANEPEVILADEPTANLDTKTADDVLDLMAHINGERRVAFVLSSHDPRVVARAQRVVTLHDGRIMGSPTQR